MTEGEGTTATATFELERFAWDTPDQLELAGRFHGLTGIGSAAPALVVHGDEGSYVLHAVGAHAWPPREDEPWREVFAWSEPPIPFTIAELDLGDGRRLELPEPGVRRPRFGRRVIELHGAEASQPAEPAGPPVEPERAAPEPAPAPEPPAPEPVAAEPEAVPDPDPDPVGTHAALVLAREEALAALARAHDAEARLEAEQERRAADAERFRASLAAVRTTAEDAVAAERAGNAALGEDLRAAHTELEDVRARLGELQGVADEARAASDAARRLRQERDDLRDRADQAERQSEHHESEMRRLRERLATVRQALADDT